MKLLRLMMLGLLLTLGNSEELQWDNLSEEQRLLARKIYYLTKPYDLELTMVAIAWQESRLGMVPINLQDPSCGVTHINLHTYLKLRKLSDTPYNRNWYCNRLINDLSLSVATSLEVLLWYKNYHKGNYSKMVKSYNAGFNINTKAADKYYKEVYHNVKILDGLRSELETNTEY